MTGKLFPVGRTEQHAVLPPFLARTFPIQLGEALAAYADRAAIREGDIILTYRDVGELIQRIAGCLAAHGIERGDRVATLLENSADHAVVWLALASYGVVGVPVNPTLPLRDVGDMLIAAKPAAVVVEATRLDASLRERVATLQPRPLILVRHRPAQSVRLVAGELALWGSVEWDSHPAVLDDRSPVRPWDLQAVMFTSGSTGRPKGTLVTQAQTITRAAVQPMHADRPVVSLVTLPLFHVVGQCRGLLGALLSGGTAIIADRFSVSRFWSDIDRYAVTHTVLLGSMARFLMKSDEPARRLGRPPVVMYMAPAIQEVAAFEARFGVIGVASYGSTEAGAICSGPANTLTCGTLHPEYTGQLADAHDYPIADGEEGELLVRPMHPWVMSPGYLDDPSATAELWRNGWFHSGDYFRADSAGQLVFTGRKKQVIRRRGENINPEMVEEALAAHPDVIAVIVVPFASENTEDDIRAIVSLREGSTVDHAGLVEHARSLLPSFAVPRLIDRQPVLPMTASGKVDRQAAASLPPCDMWDAETGQLTTKGDRETP